MRGKRRIVDTRHNRLRIIPAHAGQTKSKRVRAFSMPDHPRACGANSCDAASGRIVTGSSPRMRGKHGHLVRRNDRDRIIPAHAGQTDLSSRIGGRDQDHPRACGANYRISVAVLYRHGSSPRMRGKQSDFMRKLLSAGPSIIGFAQWLQSSYYCSCLQSSAKTPISRGTTPTSLFLGFQNSITLLLLT